MSTYRLAKSFYPHQCQCEENNNICNEKYPREKTCIDKFNKKIFHKNLCNNELPIIRFEVMKNYNKTNNCNINMLDFCERQPSCSDTGDCNCSTRNGTECAKLAPACEWNEDKNKCVENPEYQQYKCKCSHDSKNQNKSVYKVLNKSCKGVTNAKCYTGNFPLCNDPSCPNWFGFDKKCSNNDIECN